MPLNPDFQLVYICFFSFRSRIHISPLSYSCVFSFKLFFFSLHVFLCFRAILHKSFTMISPVHKFYINVGYRTETPDISKYTHELPTNDQSADLQVLHIRPQFSAKLTNHLIRCNSRFLLFSCLNHRRTFAKLSRNSTMRVFDARWATHRSGLYHYDDHLYYFLLYERYSYFDTSGSFICVPGLYLVHIASIRTRILVR